MIYVIIGPTGVGKTKLSVSLAKRINAEIINADSMQIYRQLNIGVAKITPDEKENIPHHMFDIVNVSDDYSVYNYQKDARRIIDKLLKENKNIVVVGGTGLYIKALLYDYTFDDRENKNKKLYDFKLIGLTRDRKVLYDSIDKRVDIMLENGLEDEVRNLYDKGINTRAIRTAIGYKELYDYFDGKQTFEEAIDKIKQSSRRYAKRQYTFFNNQFSSIKWYDIDEYSFDDIVLDILKN